LIRKLIIVSIAHVEWNADIALPGARPTQEQSRWSDPQLRSCWSAPMLDALERSNGNNNGRTKCNKRPLPQLTFQRYNGPTATTTTYNLYNLKLHPIIATFVIRQSLATKRNNIVNITSAMTSHARNFLRPLQKNRERSSRRKRVQQKTA